MPDTFVQSNQNQGEPTLLGANEGESGGFGGLLGDIFALGTSAYKTYTAVKSQPNQVQNQSTVKPAAADQPTGGVKTIAGLPWWLVAVGLGVVGLLFLVLVIRR
jgi:hypothetical protein